MKGVEDMAYGKYQEWLTDKGLSFIAQTMRNGATYKDLAGKMGISETTLYDWANKFPKFSEALKNNKDYADTLVENALYNKAISGDVAAITIWLCNRKGHKWRNPKYSQPQEQESNKSNAAVTALVSALMEREVKDES